jgi:hypothetical protein
MIQLVISPVVEDDIPCRDVMGFTSITWLNPLLLCLCGLRRRIFFIATAEWKFHIGQINNETFRVLRKMQYLQSIRPSKIE